MGQDCQRLKLFKSSSYMTDMRLKYRNEVFGKIREGNISEYVGQFLQVPNMSVVHSELMDIGRAGVVKSPFFLTKSFEGLFLKFNEKLKLEIKRDKKEKASNLGGRVIIMEGCHGVGKSSNLHALAGWMMCNAKSFGAEPIFLLYLPMKSLVSRSSSIEEFYFNILNIFVRTNEDLLSEEDWCSPFHLGVWKKHIQFTVSSTYEQVSKQFEAFRQKLLSPDLNTLLRSLMDKLYHFMLKRNVAFLVDDSNNLFGNGSMKEKVRMFVQATLVPWNFRNFSMVVSGTSRSAYKSYVRSLNHESILDYDECWIDSLAKEQLFSFVNRDVIEENSVFSKLVIDRTNEDRKSKDIEYLSSLSGSVPFYIKTIAKLAAKYNVNWKERKVFDGVDEVITDKCMKVRDVEDPEEYEKFVNSLMFDRPYREPKGMKIVDYALVVEKREKREGASEWKPVNSIALSSMMIFAHRSIKEKIVRRDPTYDNKSMEGIVFEKNLISWFGSGVNVSLKDVRFCEGGSPNIPMFCVRSFKPLWSTTIDDLHCSNVSDGECVMIVPEKSNFPHMDFFVVDKRDDISESTFLCFQATVGGFRNHVYHNSSVDSLGEIGSFMVNRDGWGEGGDEFSEVNGSLLLKLLDLVFRRREEEVRFKIVREGGNGGELCKLFVHVQVEEEDWELMRNFHIVYLVGKDVQTSEAKGIVQKGKKSEGVLVNNCCYMDRKCLKKNFPFIC